MGVQEKIQMHWNQKKQIYLQLITIGKWKFLVQKLPVQHLEMIKYLQN